MKLKTGYVKGYYRVPIPKILVITQTKSEIVNMSLTPKHLTNSIHDSSEIHKEWVCYTSQISFCTTVPRLEYYHLSRHDKYTPQLRR